MTSYSCNYHDDVVGTSVQDCLLTGKGLVNSKRNCLEIFGKMARSKRKQNNAKGASKHQESTTVGKSTDSSHETSQKRGKNRNSEETPVAKKNSGTGTKRNSTSKQEIDGEKTPRQPKRGKKLTFESSKEKRRKIGGVKAASPILPRSTRSKISSDLLKTGLSQNFKEVTPGYKLKPRNSKILPSKTLVDQSKSNETGKRGATRSRSATPRSVTDNERDRSSEAAQNSQSRSRSRSISRTPKRGRSSRREGTADPDDLVELEVEGSIDGTSSSTEDDTEYESEEQDASEPEREEIPVGMDEEARLNQLEKDPLFAKLFDRMWAKKEAERSDRGKETVPNNSPRVKSPSDTTIYSPILKQRRFKDTLSKFPTIQEQQNDTSAIDLINKRLGEIRVSASKSRRSRSRSGSRSRSRTRSRSRRSRSRSRSRSHRRDHRHHETTREDTRSKRYADNRILEAERAKAAVNCPAPGTLLDVNDYKAPPLNIHADLNDGHYFTSTSHVEEKCEKKCYRGRFVEMEEILPKNKNRLSDETNRFNLIHKKNGSVYAVPAKEETKITNVRRWDQAFRIYSTLYSRANPERASEILQYADTINDAACTFTWENVAYYDYHFRKLMDKNPERSWAKINTHLWAKAMRDHVKFSSLSDSVM